MTQRSSWPAEKLRELARSEAFPPLIVVGPALGYGKTATYAAVDRGDFPLEVIKFSPRRWCVRGTDLLRLVDGDNPTPTSAEDAGTNRASAEPSGGLEDDGKNQSTRRFRAV